MNKMWFLPLKSLLSRLRNKPDVKTTINRISRICNGTRWLWGRIIKERVSE